ncbi:hypothetical protein [Thalassobaculum salexigens]|uniref:hypothetical protein n=1 Tax=Thalassobaculum salexigens TaxID=455360 RepID=UPI00248DE856|nr:hypothetical protein [Thalassobaculum salexigens]
MTRSVFRLSLAVLSVLCASALAGEALAGEADVVGVEIRRSGETWSFDVTVRHADTGWDHYADRWDVVAPDGTVLATRTLHHPHVEEQPFTRSLGGVAVPAGVEAVTLRAHDSVHLYGGAEVRVVLPR